MTPVSTISRSSPLNSSGSHLSSSGSYSLSRSARLKSAERSRSNLNCPPVNSNSVCDRLNSIVISSMKELAIWELPTEIHQLILRSLSVQELGIFSCVNKYYNNYSKISCDPLWVEHCVRNFFDGIHSGSDEFIGMQKDPNAYFYLMKNGLYAPYIQFKPKTDISCMAAVDDGIFLGDGEMLTYLTFADKQLKLLQKYDCATTSLKIADNYLIAGFSNGVIECFNLQTMQSCYKCTLENSYATSFGINKDYMAVGCDDGEVFIYNMRSGKCIKPKHESVEKNFDKLNGQIIETHLSNHHLITVNMYGFCIRYFKAIEEEMMIDDTDNFFDSFPKIVPSPYDELLDEKTYFYEEYVNGVIIQNGTLILDLSCEPEDNSFRKKVYTYDLDAVSGQEDNEEVDYTFDMAIDHVGKVFSLGQKIKHSETATQKMLATPDNLKKIVYNFSDSNHGLHTFFNGQDILSITDNQMNIWNSSTLKHKQSLGSFVEEEEESAITPMVAMRGRYLCTTSDEGNFRIWCKVHANHK